MSNVFNSMKEANRLIKEINRLLSNVFNSMKETNRLIKEINRLLSKGMSSSIYLKVTTNTFAKLHFLGLKNFITRSVLGSKTVSLLVAT